MNRQVNSSKSAVAAWLSAALVTVLPVAAATAGGPRCPTGPAGGGVTFGLRYSYESE